MFHSVSLYRCVKVLCVHLCMKWKRRKMKVWKECVKYSIPRLFIESKGLLNYQATFPKLGMLVQTWERQLLRILSSKILRIIVYIIFISFNHFNCDINERCSFCFIPKDTRSNIFVVRSNIKKSRLHLLAHIF